VGCEQQLSRWMHQFKSIYLKVRVGYSSNDRARFVASAVQRCPAILQICEIIMRQGPLRINVRPGPDGVIFFKSIQDLPQVHPRVVEIWVLCAIIAKLYFSRAVTQNFICARNVIAGIYLSVSRWNEICVDPCLEFQCARACFQCKRRRLGKAKFEVVVGPLLCSC
jgi:hypothetical protein